MAVTPTPYPLRADDKPRAVWPAHLEHLTMPYTWHSGCGRISLTFADLEQCRLVTHPGPCDLDVADLSTEPAIAVQLAAIDPAQLSAELDGYGAEWDLTDHAQNLQRVLWIAAGDVSDNPESHADDEVAP